MSAAHPPTAAPPHDAGECRGIDPARPLVILRRCRARDVERLAHPLAPGPLTRQAISGYQRSAAGKRARHARTWGLLAEVVDPPLVPSLDEHRARKAAAAEAAWRAARKDWADQWRRARARLRELPRARARELLDEWNRPRDDLPTGARAAPSDLLMFLSTREPPEALHEHRRQGRLHSAAIHRDVMRRIEAWYVQHLTCPEGALGIAHVQEFPRRVVRCIACEREWRTRAEVAAAEETGELRMVDCRLAEQLELAPLPAA
ncbi:MAG: hypothetical protein JWM27_4860 [Gemmatimonadetes bacterium]|nr:hypothetical protein [Gemmatimonadota bacterium]